MVHVLPFAWSIQLHHGVCAADVRALRFPAHPRILPAAMMREHFSRSHSERADRLSANAHLLKWVLHACVVVIACCCPTPALSTDADNASSERVSQIFVLRRPLDRQPLNSIGPFAHSALLLQTEQGNSYVLEYHGDAIAHLTPGRQKAIVENRRKGVATIKMAGWANGRVAEFYWERQLIGEPVAGVWSPRDLQRIMQSSMNGYSLLKKEHCHAAQQRLRAEVILRR